jgi:hypothetical protein
MAETKADLAQWIETDVIAEAILDELQQQGVEPTIENAKRVWLDVLENGLPQGLKASIKARFDEEEDEWERHDWPAYEE